MHLQHTKELFCLRSYLGQNILVVCLIFAFRLLPFVYFGSEHIQLDFIFALLNTLISEEPLI